VTEGLKDFQKNFSHLWWFRVRGKEAKLVKLSEPPLFKGEHVMAKLLYRLRRQIEGKGYR